MYIQISPAELLHDTAQLIQRAKHRLHLVADIPGQKKQTEGYGYQRQEGKGGFIPEKDSAAVLLPSAVRRYVSWVSAALPYPFFPRRWLPRAASRLFSLHHP